MFNKMKSIFGKNNKRLKSVLASILLSVGCTGTSLANPKSVNLSTEKRTEKNKDLVNTYDVMQIVNMVNESKKEVGETLALIITSIFGRKGYNKVAPKVNDYMVRRALDKIDVYKASDEEIRATLDKIRNVDKVSDKVLDIAGSIIEKYLKIAKRKKIVNDDKNTKLSKLQLSADEWFTKLGGTQKDIDKYKEPDLSKINKKNNDVIEKDYVRSGFNDSADGDDAVNFDQKRKLLKEILQKFEVEEFPNYTQGYNCIAAVVIRKFTEGDKKMQEGEQFSKEKEAKIYYVFKTIVQTMVNYSIGKNGINYGNHCQTLNSLYDRMLLSFCKRNNVNEIDKCLFLDTDCSIVVYPIMALNHLKLESQIFLWDSIISEIKDEKFDPNVALEKIFDVWFARALQVQKEYISSDLYKSPGGILGLQAFMKNDSI